MKKLGQRLLTIASALVILLFIAYGGFWFYVAGQMHKTLDDIWAHQDRYQIAISGAQPNVGGFPAPPKVIFAGQVTDRNGFTYTAPEFIYQGFTLPTQAIRLTAPQGLDFTGPIFKVPVHLDSFRLRVRIPAGFPNRADRETLLAWREKGGTLPIEKLDIARGSLRMQGDGYLTLDKDLQPTGTITVQVSGLDDLLNELVENGTVGKQQALMAQSLINLMSQKDPATGASVLNTGIRIQDSGVFLGPLRVASIPEWKWQ